MLRTPAFESIGIVTDNAILAANLSALFVRADYYLPVIDGPRMGRPDASNEVIRRVNALVSAKIETLLLGGLKESARDAMACDWHQCHDADDFETLASKLPRSIKRRKAKLRWGPTNLGVGVYRARLAKMELAVTLDHSPTDYFVQRGTHFLVACEAGNEMAQIAASNLAFACKASFTTFPQLPEEECKDWLEELYGLGEGGDTGNRFSALSARARAQLPNLPFHQYEQVLFVTSGFPWGICVPERPSTHMFAYPDCGRAIIEGLWAAQNPTRTARTALLIDPEQVEGSEVSEIAKVLRHNRTLTRVVKGPAATVHRVQNLVELIPHDIIVISTHAGDAPGERLTYEYEDANGKQRRLVVDRATSLSYDRATDMFPISEYYRFHSLDGVAWSDTAGKAALPVGSAISTWQSLGGILERGKYIVRSEKIDRVAGAMALQLHDDLWLAAIQGFTPGSAPLILNNACSSWHQLSRRMTFAGARGYIGALFPVLDPEAQEVGHSLFGEHINEPLPMALWLTQNSVYRNGSRRPYAMVGLPFTALKSNTADSIKFLRHAYQSGIAQYRDKAANSPHKDVRENSKRNAEFLAEDFESFKNKFPHQRPSPGAA